MKLRDARFYFFVGLFFLMVGLLLTSPHLIQQLERTNSQPVYAAGVTQAGNERKATISGTP